jgi:Tfp pilus assembly protein PilN
MANVLPNNVFAVDHLGLSLSTSTLRAVVLGPDHQFHASMKVDLEADTYQASQINIPKLSGAVKQLIQTGNLTSPYVAITLPDYESYSRIHTIPKMDLSEVTEALNWQIDNIFPLSKDEIYFDWKLLQTTETELTILIIAVSKRLIDDLIRAFEQSGLKPVSIEPASSILTRVINLPDQQSYVLINLNQTDNSASLVINKTSSLTITNQYSPDSLNQTSKSLLPLVSQSVQSLLNYHNSKDQGNTSPPKLIATGDALVPEVIKKLPETLGQTPEIINFNNLPTEFNQAYAAAISSIQPPEDSTTINLLPILLRESYTAQQQYSKTITRTIIFCLLLGISVIVSLGIFVFTSSIYSSVLAESQKVNQDITTSTSFDQTEISLLNRASNTIVKLFPKKTSPTAILDEIYQLKPEEILLRQLIYDKDKNKITLSGTATSRSALLNFRDKLKQSPSISDINMPLGTLQKITDIDFSVIITIKPIPTKT